MLPKPLCIFLAVEVNLKAETHIAGRGSKGGQLYFLAIQPHANFVHEGADRQAEWRTNVDFERPGHREEALWGGTCT
jgi:hypothetical protein